MSTDIRWIKPAAGEKLKKGVTFPVTFEQQAQGSSGAVATLQFSAHEDGPWETSRSIGGGGALEANMIPWDSRDTGFILPEARQHQACWARGGIFQDQSLTGPPVLASNAVLLKAPMGVTETPVEDT